MQEIEGIGEVMAKSIITYFHDEKNLEIVNRLRGYGLQMELSEAQTANVSDKLAGQSIVISGVLPITVAMSTRPSLNKMVVRT